MKGDRKKLTPKNRLLLYVDILGFREKVKDADAAASVYQTIDTCLRASAKAIENAEGFGTIYFSDTILFYSRDGGFSHERFKKLCDVATDVFNQLLANHVPISGAITFGPFYIRKKRDSDGQPIEGADPRLYFGQPLIEAYDAAKLEKWLGIIVCPSVTERFNPDYIDTMGRAFWQKRRDGKHFSLLLNPYFYLERYYQTMVRAGEKRKRELLHPASELESLRFLMTKVRQYSKDGDFSTAPAFRYHATMAFVRWTLSAAAFKWATGRDPLSAVAQGAY